jgi:hypothetical protein
MERSLSSREAGRKQAKDLCIPRPRFAAPNRILHISIVRHV